MEYFSKVIEEFFPFPLFPFPVVLETVVLVFVELEIKGQGVGGTYFPKNRDEKFTKFYIYI